MLPGQAGCWPGDREDFLLDGQAIPGSRRAGSRSARPIEDPGMSSSSSPQPSAGCYRRGRGPTADVLESIEQTVIGLRRLPGLLRKTCSSTPARTGWRSRCAAGAAASKSTSLTTGPRPRRPLRAASACSGCANESPSTEGQRRPPPRRRPHRALGQAAPRRPLPEPITEPGQITRMKIRRQDRLSGTLDRYRQPPDQARRIIGARRMLLQDQPRDRNRSRAARASHE